MNGGGSGGGGTANSDRRAGGDEREARLPFSPGQTPRPPDTLHGRHRPHGALRNPVSEENAPKPPGGSWKDSGGSEGPTEGPVCLLEPAGWPGHAIACYGRLHRPWVPGAGPASAFRIKRDFSLCTDQRTQLGKYVNNCVKSIKKWFSPQPHTS